MRDRQGLRKTVGAVHPPHDVAVLISGADGETTARANSLHDAVSLAAMQPHLLAAVLDLVLPCGGELDDPRVRSGSPH